jgi:topoisomerase (DNA) II binding protein 1
LQDKLLRVDHFQPKPLTSEDKDADPFTVSQYSTQATRFDSSELLSGSQVTINNATHNLVIVHFTSSAKKLCSPQTHCARIAGISAETTMPAVSRKRRISVPGKVNDTCRNIGRSEKNLDNSSVPDVTDAIEVLSSKVTLMQSIHFTITNVRVHG